MVAGFLFIFFNSDEILIYFYNAKKSSEHYSRYTLWNLIRIWLNKKPSTRALGRRNYKYTERRNESVIRRVPDKPHYIKRKNENTKILFFFKFFFYSLSTSIFCKFVQKVYCTCLCVSNCNLNFYTWFNVDGCNLFNDFRWGM